MPNPTSPRFDNPFLKLYLEYAKDTECPLLYDIWCAISGVSAALGRRIFYNFGVDTLFPNTYVILVGPPALRKGSAMKWMKKPLTASTNIRFAPDDTAGQRQGLIQALLGDDDETGTKDDLDTALDAIGVGGDFESAIGQIRMQLRTDAAPDRFVLYAYATELDSFLGTNSRDLATFLIKMWDGEPYKYRTSKDKKVLSNCTMSILGATTPENLNQALPTSSIGQGFLSRFILVHGGQKKNNFQSHRPPEPDPKLYDEIKDHYNWLYWHAEGEIKATKEAEHALDEIYKQPTELDDQRFIHYCNRRITHLVKTALILAAARKSKFISEVDVYEANAILSATEQYMPDALGEFGLSPAAMAKQRLLEYLQAATKPVSGRVLWSLMARDMKNMHEFTQALQNLINAGQVAGVEIPERGGTHYVYKQKKSKLFELLRNEGKVEEQKVTQLRM